jgi:hypothetical protein
VRVVDRSSGEDIAEVRVLSHDGRELETGDVLMAPGPGAGAATRARFMGRRRGEAAPSTPVPELPASSATTG